MKILQLCLRSPFPPRDGGAIAMESLSQSMFNNGAEVHIVCFNTRKHYVDPDLIQADLKSRFKMIFVDLDAKVSVLGAFQNLFTKKSYNISRFDHPNMHDRLRMLLKNELFDSIVVESLFMLPYVKTIRQFSSAKIIYRSHNIEYVIWQKLADQCANPFKKWYLKLLSKRLKLYEQNIIHQVDAIVPLTEADGLWFKQSGYFKPIKVIPIGVDLAKYQVTLNDSSNGYIFHVGSMEWLPNVEGINWFIENVWPIVHNQCSFAKLFLAGKGMPENILRLSSNEIHVSGFVNDMSDFMRDKQIMIVPLLSGSGMRVKILEGMAAGRTIISTTLGAEGIQYSDGRDILIADTPEDFATQILKCINQPNFSKELGEHGQSLIARQYDYKSIGKKLMNFMLELKTESV